MILNWALFAVWVITTVIKKKMYLLKYLLHAPLIWWIVHNQESESFEKH